MNDSASYAPPALPPVAQPKGVRYFLGTWSGRILLVNTAVFLAMCMKSGAVFMPDNETLWLFGAKDPYGLARGEYWRFLTPIFVHAGIIHFAFNSLAIYFIGYQLERILGGRWFLFIYLAAGIGGNVSSSVFVVHPSVGASGALFGLLGCGFYLEYTIGRKIRELTGRTPRNRIYTGMVVINIILGFSIPGIDNAAHLGGLITGIILTYSMVNLRPNRLRVPRRKWGITAISALALLQFAGAVIATQPAFQTARLTEAADDSDHPGEAFRLYTEALKIDPENTSLRFRRGRLLLLAGSLKEAMMDLREAAADPERKEDFVKLIDELKSAGMNLRAWELQTILDHAQKGYF